MAFFMIFLALATSLVFGTEAFKVSFFKNTNCAGEFVGAWIGGEGQGCRQEYAGLAEGVVVESTGPVDDSTTVQFYSSEDCTPGTEMSRADAGCLTVDQGVVGAYKSFQVVATTNLGVASSKRRSPDQRRYPFAPSSITRAVAPTPQIYHGMQLSFEGTDYKLHQIYANAYIGILPDEWDDSIHVLNDTDLEHYELSPTLIDRDVDERDLVEALCNTFATCIAAARAGGPVIKGAVTPVFKSVKTVAQAGGQKALDLLQSPFFTQVAVDTLAGLVPGAVGGVVQAVVGAQVAGNANNVAACSRENDQIDALISIVNSQISALSAASAKITAQQNDAGDEVFTVTVTVVACGTSLESSACGVTGGFCPS